MKYSKRSRKPLSQKGGHAPCLDSVPSSCYKVIVNMHGAMRYEDRNTLSEINFPFASLKYYVPNGHVASFEPDYDLPSYLGDICNDRPELIIEEVPKQETPDRLKTAIINLIAVKGDLNTLEQEKSVDAGTMIDIGNYSAPNYGGIYLCTPASAARGLAAFNERAQIDEILSTNPRAISAPPNALRKREEKIRTRNEKYATPLESAIKLFSERELVQIPQLYNSANGSVRQTIRSDDEINKNLIKKLMLIEPVVDAQEMKWDAEDAEDAAKASAAAAAAAQEAIGKANATEAALAAEKAAEKAMQLANAAKVVKYKSFHLGKLGDDIIYKIEHIIRIVKPQLNQRGIDIANCELCIFSCRSWTPAERTTGFKPDTAEAIAEDKLTGAPPTRFANYKDFMKEKNRRDDEMSKKVSQMEKDEIGISKYTTNKAEKRRQNEEWLIRRALKLSPRKDVPNRLQNVYTESVIRTDNPKHFTYTLQNGDEYGKYTPTWNAEWANLKQRWYRNGEPYNPATLANIAKGRELVLRKGTQLNENNSPVLIRQIRDLLIGMQAGEVLNDNPYINVTPSQLYAYLSPPERPSIESVLEAVSDEEIKNYVIVDELDNDSAKLLIDIQTNSMDSISDPQCPSHEKIPQPCTTETPYRKQSLIFHPDKNLKCRNAATKKFNYLSAICKESGNNAGGSRKQKRGRTRRINARRRKTQRR